MNYLSCLVLGNLVLGVLLALLTLAVGASGLWDVDLGENVSFVVGGVFSLVYLVLWMLAVVVARGLRRWRERESGEGFVVSSIRCHVSQAVCHRWASCRFIESIRLEPVPLLVPRNMRIEAIKAVGQSIQRRDTPV